MSGNLAEGGGGGAGPGGGGAGKLYPMDLAVSSQKITIMKSAGAGIPGGCGVVEKATKTAHLLSHTGPVSLVRPTPQIISQGVATQPQMIVSGTPLLQGTQILGQSTQLNMSQNSQLNQLMSSQTQIISQGTHLINQGSQSVGGPSCGAGSAQMINVGASLVSGGGVVVSTASGLRALPSSMRVLPPQQHNTRPVISSVTVTAISGTGPNSLNKLGPALVGVSSHVPRGPAAGASLAVPRASARPAAPATNTLPVSTLGGGWNANVRGGLRGTALMYSARATLPRGPQPRQMGPTGGATLTPISMQTQPPSNNSLTATLSAGGVISPVSRVTLPRAAPVMRVPAPHAQRPLPLVQRNYQPAKVVGVASVGPRGVSPSNNLSAGPAGLSHIPRSSALFYEVSRPASVPAPPPTAPPASAFMPLTSRPLMYNHTTQTLPAVTMTVLPVTQPQQESRLALSTPPSALAHAAPPPRPSILRKREVDGSPSKSVGVSSPWYSSPAAEEPPGWERVRDEEGDGEGSTTVSAGSSPAPDDEPLSPPRPATPQHDISPRKKPRKQMLSSEVRHCEFPPEEPPPSPPAPAQPPKRRSLLGPSWVCGWRATALHFMRPGDVRRRETKEPQVVELANQKNILNKTKGWKVHHLTAQMDDLMELESGIVEQLGGVLRVLEAPANKPGADKEFAPQLHAVMELVKGNMQRSRIVCEGMGEARTDVLRVFSHRTYVTDILARQADKRSFRKHRPQS